MLIGSYLDFYAVLGDNRDDKRGGLSSTTFMSPYSGSSDYISYEGYSPLFKGWFLQRTPGTSMFCASKARTYKNDAFLNRNSIGWWLFVPFGVGRLAYLVQKKGWLSGMWYILQDRARLIEYLPSPFLIGPGRHIYNMRACTRVHSKSPSYSQRFLVGNLYS